MQGTILEKLAKRAPRLGRDSESRLHSEIKRIVSKIKATRINKKHKRSGRGGLTSVGARGVVLKDGDIYCRRVIVKASYISSSDEKARGRIRHHLNYVGRQTLGEEAGELYSNVGKVVNVKDAIDDFQKAPHMFNIIISPEDGDKIDLKEFSRDFVKAIERDLRTRLDWVAGNHFDTNEPHVHMLIKGLDDTGKRLVISRDYISRGMRVRASQVINKKLGLRQLDDIVTALKLDAGRCKKCALDDIIAKNAENGFIDLGKLKHGYDLPKALFEQRLEFLEGKELATRGAADSWQIKEGFIKDLKSLARSSSIIEKLSGSLRVDRRDCEVVSAKTLADRCIKGHVVERGYADDVSGKEYLLVKSKEKAFVYVELEKFSEKSSAAVGEFVRIDVTKPFSGPKVSDASISKFAQENGGIYSAKVHEDRANSIGLPPGVTAKDYVQVHVNRLEVLSRRGLVERIADGSYRIPKDYLARLSAESNHSKEGYQPHIKITRLSPARIAGPTLARGLKQ